MGKYSAYDDEDDEIEREFEEIAREFELDLENIDDADLVRGIIDDDIDPIPDYDADGRPWDEDPDEDRFYGFR